MARFDLEDYPVHGEVKIDLDCSHPGDNVTLHAKNMTVTFVSVATAEGAELTIEDESYDAFREFFVVRLAEDLQAGRSYRIHMKYEGRLQRDLVGYYLSRYDEGGTTRSVLFGRRAREAPLRARTNKFSLICLVDFEPRK